MDLLLKAVKIIDPNSPFNGQRKDILIKKGKIEKIQNTISAKTKTIDAKNISASPGWFDLKVNFCEPGFEFKEDLKSGISAAKAGGFSAAAHVPSLNPVTSNRSQVEYLTKRAQLEAFELLPIGSLTANSEGKVISEMFDMYQGGAKAFSDFDKDLKSGILLKALEYVKSFNALIISMPLDHSLSNLSYVHEGIHSTALGLKGIPSIAEEIRIERDLNIVRYSQGKIHFSGISSKKGVDLIRKAKKEGLDVTADVYLHNLVFTDESILEFDSNKKIFPPARTEKDRKALLKGLKDGTIDAITSDHCPQNIEGKEIEFEYSEFGIAGIEFVFPLLLELGLSIETIVAKISINPRNIMQIDCPVIDKGQQANITLFNSKEHFLLTAEESKSKSKNNPYLNKELKGKVLGVVANNQLDLNL